jgi:hypothetical protein
MNKLMLYTLSGLMLLSALAAQANTEAITINCENAYREKSIREIQTRDRVGTIGTTLYVGGGIGGAMIGNLPVTLVTMFTGLPLALWGGQTKGGATKSLNLLEEESRQMRRFLKTLHRDISRSITHEDVVLSLQQELENGNLCADYPKLWGHSKIKRHIKRDLEHRFKK